MSDSFAKVNVHVIFHVRSTSPKIRKEDAHKLYAYLRGILGNHKSYVYELDGYRDHIHILCTLPCEMAIADFIKEAKQSSSKYIKTLGDYYHAFQWQRGYGAFSVSPSLIEPTARYIQDQDNHHKRISYYEEITNILQHYGITYKEEYVDSD